MCSWKLHIVILHHRPCLFILYTLLHNISVGFVLFSLGIMFSRSACMYIETVASAQPRIQLQGSSHHFLPVQGLQILLFSLLTTLRSRLSRDNRTFFSEEKAEGNCAHLPCRAQILW